MFEFFKKKDCNVYAPVAGTCKDITCCSDNVFAEKMVGDGFLIEPEDDVIASPCDGEITMIFPTLHAFGITTADDKEILVHIGVNTVELNGKHFQKLCEEKKKVKKGDPIVSAKINEIKALGYDISVMVIFTNGKEITKNHLNEKVTTKDVIVSA